MKYSYVLRQITRLIPKEGNSTMENITKDSFEKAIIDMLDSIMHESGSGQIGDFLLGIRIAIHNMMVYTMGWSIIKVTLEAACNMLENLYNN